MDKLLRCSTVLLRILVLTAVSLVFVAGCFFANTTTPTPNPPPECGNLCSYEFWETATLSDVETELEAGADVNGAKGSDFNSPLHQAIEHNGHPAIIELLLDQGADVNASGYTRIFVHHASRKSPRSPLSLTADLQGSGRYESVRLLLEYGADPTPPTKIEFPYYLTEQSALHFAARLWTEEDRAIVVLLLEHGADVNARSSDRSCYGCTPFHRSMSEADPALIELLLEHGADIRARTNPAFATPLHIAAAVNPNPDSIAVLLKHSADVNAKDQARVTPLHLASGENVGAGGFVEQRSLEVVKVLLDSGADVSAKDDEGQTPLHWATEHSLSYDLVALLLEYGADANVKDRGGITPLHLAAQCSSNPTIAALLIQNGAEVNAKTVGEQTPLHSSVERASAPCGRPEQLPKAQVISLLIEKGGDPNATDQNNMTPCQRAEIFEWSSEIKRLLCR